MPWCNLELDENSEGKKMKSKKGFSYLAIGLVAVIALFLLLLLQQNRVFGIALTEEWVDNTFPERLDDVQDPSSWNTLPYGYTLGPWPSDFEGEPIVTKMTYQKGPPQKFIQAMTQVWKPVEVEVTLEGPKTVIAGKTAAEWKQCFGSSFSCGSEKQQFLEYAFPHLKKTSALTVKWFDNLDPQGTRGVHFHIDAGSYQIDRYSIISEQGVVQNISLKFVANPVGLEAQTQFIKIIGGLKVKDDLTSARDWIQTKIKSVELNSIRAISDPKLRLRRLIQVQNWIFSHLSVDPTQMAPFFHLAGVTHLLTMDLLRMQKPIFSSQESWILNSKPLLESLISYTRDFQNSEQPVRNIESLLQDVLMLQQKMTTGHR